MAKEIYEQNFNGKDKKISVKCNTCEYKFNTTSARINQGFGCEKCGYKSSADKRRTPFEEVQKTVENAGYTLITKDYIRFSQKLEIFCPKHGIFLMNLNDITSGRGCRDCSHTSPKAQKELYSFIKDFYPDAINNDRSLIKPLELDIYVPSLKLAIEYCGLYWHSEEYKANDDHYNKMRLCNEKGIRLITVFEDEWLERKEQVKNFLLSVIGKNEINVMGRKTEIKKVPKEETVYFLEKSHIQGSSLFEIAFGLYYNNELVGIITGNKHHRQGHENLFVLNRLAFKSNISVSGGSSKLLKALIQYARDKGYSKLISWSDNRWSEGNVYEKTGFSLTEELSPDYSYVQKQARISKQSCQKKNLVKKGAIGNTEREMALSLKLHRIYDCGKKRWEINLS
jgi:N-acetylglutamate synthase-like GNAT family acetyltransferase